MAPVERALKLLARRQRTVQELNVALERAGVSASEREEAVARLRELGYIDDREVARARARTAIGRGDGTRLLQRKLQAQGIAKVDVAAAVTEAVEGASEDELAARAVLRRTRGKAPADEREKRRLLRKLISRGHRASAAAKALGVEWNGDDDIDEDR